MESYAQGYTSKDVPIRMTQGALWSETYGVRTTAATFCDSRSQHGMLDLDETLQRAITGTHTDTTRWRDDAGSIWEQYATRSTYRNC